MLTTQRVVFKAVATITNFETLKTEPPVLTNVDSSEVDIYIYIYIYILEHMVECKITTYDLLEEETFF